MRILVVGAGALGSVFGCLLGDKGHEVGLVEPGSRLEDIRNYGLRVKGIFGEHKSNDFKLYASAEEVPANYYELILITVKSFNTAQAAQQIAPKAGPNSLVVSLQNGIGNFEAISKFVGEHRTLAGRVIFGAQIRDKSTAEVTVYAEPVMIGSPNNAVNFIRIEEIAQMFSDAGIPTQATNQIVKYIWAKILYNCSLNPLSALLNVPYGKLLDSEGTRTIITQVIEEIFRVANAHSIELFWQQPCDYISILFEKLIPDTAAHNASMAQDIQAGRKTEIEALNGAIVRLGREKQVDCPVNNTLYMLIKAAETVNNA